MFIQIVIGSTTGGSPPLTRGKENDGDTSDLFPGITPAYAGKSNWKILEKYFLRDHPRLRGEKLLTLSSLSLQPGSPPLTRGKEDIL